MPRLKLPEEKFFRHPSSIVETDRVGTGTRIWAWSHIQKNVRSGGGCNIGEHCFLEEGVQVGDRVVVKNNVCLWKGVTIGDGAFIGPGVIFSNEIYPRSGFRKEFLPTRIETGASIGAGAVVMPGITIGRYATVGAASVVTKAVPDHALVYGSPAKPRGWMCICGLKIVFEKRKARCQCGRRFGLENRVVKLIE